MYEDTLNTVIISNQTKVPLKGQQLCRVGGNSVLLTRFVERAVSLGWTKGEAVWGGSFKGEVST